MQLWAETERRYGRRIRAIYPDRAALERLVAKQGIDGIYESKRAREACCDVRKTRPLDRALAGAAAWITGLRADQNDNRRDAGLDRLRRQPRPAQVQSAVRLDARGGAGRGAPPRRSDQCAARQRLRLDRLRALHARAQARRTRAQRPLVVGAGRQHANAACICRATRAARDNLRRDHVEISAGCG